MSLLDHFAAAGVERVCRGCGCSDNNACVIRGVACCWVLLDIETPTGVCSACAVRSAWAQDFFISGWCAAAVEHVEAAA